MKQGIYLITIALILMQSTIFAQCNGSFGEPVFFEDFGVSNGSVYGGPLQPPASTSYQYVANPSVNDGQYTITTNPTNALNVFFNTPDATQDPGGQQGNMLVVNADFTPGEFYRRRVSNLCNNGDSVYRFSAKLMNVLPLNNPCAPNTVPINVTFGVYDIAGNLLGSISTGFIDSTNNPIWRDFSFDFQLPNGINQLDLVLFNNAPGGCGNDLAIDDIAFQICGDDLGVNPSVDIFGGDNCNAEPVELTANLGSNTINNPIFDWQISLTNGASWQSLGCETATCTLQPNDYSNGALIRYSVVSAETNTPNCRLFSAPEQVNLNEFSPPEPPDLQEYSTTATAEFNLQQILDFYNNGGGNNWTFRFYETNADLQNGNNIANINTYESENRTLLVQIQANGTNCVVVREFDLEVLTPLDFVICDSDADGVDVVNFQELLGFINQNFQTNGNTEESKIYLANRTAGIAELVEPEGAQQYSFPCQQIPGINTYFELAVNNRRELFLATGEGQLHQIDLDNCTAELVIDLPDGYNLAMSFDTNNNLYVGGFSSTVLVAREADGYQNFEVWHNFPNGRPAGDFIEINNKLYISWDISNSEFLFEVTLDEQNNYVSHTNLGQILNNSFGMAGELGVLYGVTTSQVYRIDLNPFGTEVLFNNPDGGSNNRWFGAAGRNEAVVVDVYATEIDAENQTNPITEDFLSNILPTGFVFVRIGEAGSSNVQIIPIRIVVNPRPELSNVQNVILCNGPQLIDTELDTNVYGFEWRRDGNVLNGESSPQLLVDQAGTYELILINLQTQCEYSYTFEAIGNQSEIVRHFVVGNQATLFANNSLNNQYSLDGANYQTSNQFFDLDNQLYTANILDENDCPGEDYEFEVVPTQTFVSCNPVQNFAELENQIKSIYSVDVSAYVFSLHNNEADAIANSNAIVADFSANAQTYFYRLESNQNQSVYIQSLELSVNPPPIFDLEESYVFCVDDPNSSAEINTNLQGNFLFEWFLNGTLIPNESQNSLSTRTAGTYTLAVTDLNNNCRWEQSTNVLGSQVTINSVNINNNQVTVNASGGNILEYAANGGPWQSANLFGLSNGETQLLARNENGCVSEVFLVTIFSIPNAITPNNDGKNDQWIIDGLQNYPEASLKIYDRYGKLIYNQTGANIKPWNATYLGSPLPSGTYWYQLYVNQQQQFTGFITVKRN